MPPFMAVYPTQIKMKHIRWTIKHKAGVKLSGLAVVEDGTTLTRECKLVQIWLSDFRNLMGYGENDDYAVQFETQGE